MVDKSSDIIEVFPWNKNFETGIAQIDEQHQQLVHLLNELAGFLGNKSDPVALNQLFAELASYADHHFKTEESVWQHYFKDDSWNTEHHKVHENFIENVLALKEEENVKPLEIVVEDILKFLIHWLAFHILDSDMRMSKAVHAIDSGMALEEAKHQAEIAMSGSMKVLVETVLSMYDNLSSRTLELMRERTERKRAEEKLRISEKKEKSFSDAITNSIPGLLYLYDEELHLIRWNKKHVDVTGYSDDELAHKSLLDFFEERYHPQVISSVHSTFAEGYLETEGVLLSKDGTKTPYLFTSVPLNIEGKKHFLGIGINIKSRKIAENRLIRSKQMHEEAQKLAHLGHWQLNLKKGGLIWSDEVFRILELDKAQTEPSYEAFLSIVHPDDRAIANKLHADFISQHEAYEVVHRLLMDDQRIKFIRRHCRTEYDSHGNPAYSVGTIHDITQEVLSEQKLKGALHGVVASVSKALEARDPYTAGHQQRVAEISIAIAEKMGLDSDQVEGIRLGATVHDIGKLSVPTELLVKPTRLNELEYSLIRNHALGGLEIMEGTDFPWPITDIISQHHERLDGSGYPYGLKGDEICLEARIVAVADVFEAMSAHRPYRPALGPDRAIEELRSNRGKFYCPEAVDALLSLLDEDKDRFSIP